MDHMQYQMVLRARQCLDNTEGRGNSLICWQLWRRGSSVGGEMQVAVLAGASWEARKGGLASIICLLVCISQLLSPRTFFFFFSLSCQAVWSHQLVLLLNSTLNAGKHPRCTNFHPHQQWTPFSCGCGAYVGLSHPGSLPGQCPSSQGSWEGSWARVSSQVCAEKWPEEQLQTSPGRTCALRGYLFKIKNKPTSVEIFFRPDYHHFPAFIGKFSPQGTIQQMQTSMVQLCSSVPPCFLWLLWCDWLEKKVGKQDTCQLKFPFHQGYSQLDKCCHRLTILCCLSKVMELIQ